MGGGGGTPGPTAEEKKLGELASNKYDMAASLSGGADYLTQDAQVDRTQRYTELALGDTARMLGAMKETPASPVTGPVDLSSNLLAINAGRTQADLETAAKQNALAQNSLGTVADSTAAMHQEGLRKQALAQSQQELKAASTQGLVNMASSLGTVYAMNHKKINAGVSDLFKSAEAPKLKINTPWEGR